MGVLDDLSPAEIQKIFALQHHQAKAALFCVLQIVHEVQYALDAGNIECKSITPGGIAEWLTLIERAALGEEVHGNRDYDGPDIRNEDHGDAGSLSTPDC